MTPKTLSDLKYQDWVIDLNPTDSAQIAAENILNQLLPDERPVYCRQLFVESDIRVYEAYKDSGSTDYLYIKEPIN